MLKRLLSMLMCLVMLASVAQIATAEQGCAHAQKRQVAVGQPPVYISEGGSGHRVIVDTMLYWECVSCGERFSGKPGDSIITREGHTFVNNVCSRCGYAEKLLGALKSNGTITLNVGQRLQLVPTFATYSGWTVTGYKSSRPWVAIVSATGEVTAIAEGSATITVTTANKKKATLRVKVVNPFKPTGVSIAQGKSITVSLGQTLQLSAVLAPATAQSALTWKTSKKRVAVVSGSGLVTPLKEGTAKITVTTANKKKATIKVKVVDPYKPTGVAITGGGVTLQVGQTLQLGAVVAPATARTTLSWKSGRRRVAVVSSTGLVTALRPGKATITVTTANKKKARITVRVVR